MESKKDRKFDHEQNDIYLACGFTEKEVGEFQKKSTEIAAKEKKISQKVEALSKNFTPHELAFGLVMIQMNFQDLMDHVKGQDHIKEALAELEKAMKDG